MPTATGMKRASFGEATIVFYEQVVDTFCTNIETEVKVPLGTRIDTIAWAEAKCFDQKACSRVHEMMRCSDIRKSQKCATYVPHCDNLDASMLKLPSSSLWLRRREGMISG
eukprot:TRINITY_DN62910_c0_g1_i1.p1 TRINITY_DN62910_c0_g1~~TRINITY_DN62910_c0_g1_i1.p1  ORF type:complete len:111 (-),score=18.63 TRINITY_DN62910_c0_g1_i1:57-389(-)